MIVSQLIQELLEMDQTKEVLIDVSKTSSGFFHFKEINTVGVGQDSQGWEFVALVYGSERPETDNSN